MREPTATTRVQGGYVLIRAGHLLSVLEALQAKIIAPLDVRAWLACHELVARRCGARKGMPVRYTREELRDLVGTETHDAVDASLLRLWAGGFLHWAPEQIAFARTTARDPRGLPLNRLVPIPRRTLRFLAAGCSRSVAATMLATLLRCAFYRRGVCSWTGTCKASWIAELFAIDERSVKRARAQLQQLGWLTGEHAPQWRLNRYGGVFQVNPDWAPGAPNVSPPRANHSPEVSPPESDQEPLREHKHQEPAASGPSGVLGYAFPASVANIQPADLRRRTRMLDLHADACRRGLAELGEAGRLRFASLVARARRVGAENPCRLLAWMLREQRWDLVTLADEDRARSWMVEHSREAAPSSEQVCDGLVSIASVAGKVVRGTEASLQAA